VLTVAAHGRYHTHFDAISHFFFDGAMYNGVPASEIAEDGARELDVLTARGGVVSRGVLLDVGAGRPGGYVHVDEPVRLAELIECEARADLAVQPGDVVLIRLARALRWDAEGGSDCERAPDGGNRYHGLHPEVLTWLRERDVALMVSDLGHDKFPVEFGLAYPVHIGCLVFLGMSLIDNAELEALARACARRKQWDFLFAVAPLALPGSTSSLVNPIAVL
jgi:kynurenine formamidase